MAKRRICIFHSADKKTGEKKKDQKMIKQVLIGK